MGLSRGKKLKTLEGDATRPTSERAKEAIFSSLFTAVSGANVLDLFSGSGQMGIEAISRGAARCTFVDQARAAADIIRENVKACRFEDKSLLLQREVSAYIVSANAKFDLIFLDPPYGKDLVNKTMTLIDKHDLLANDGIIVAESDDVDPVGDTFGKLVLYKTAKYGRAVIRYYKIGGDNV